ncbi:hypothetical protein E4U52_007850, partial [Claviceps spartinae]
MADQLERNLNNDTADFRAHQAALNLTQTNRPKNTSRNYDPITKEWQEFPDITMKMAIWCTNGSS